MLLHKAKQGGTSSSDKQIHRGSVDALQFFECPFEADAKSQGSPLTAMFKC